ncbi:MAG: HDIG domain-containing protein [Clostridia bacterium]|nr:HDIG domain-containing protein [Clostridia bacterium]
MKTLQSKTAITAVQVVKDVAVILVNILIIIGIYVGSIALNATNESAISFNDYFNGRADFIYLLLSTVLFISILLLCMYFDDKSFFKEAKNLEMLFAIVEITLIVCCLIGRYLSVYLRPLALVSLLAVQFFGKRSAVYITLTNTLLVFLTDIFTNTLLLPNNPDLYASLFMGYSTAILAIYLIGGVSVRLTAIMRGFVLGVTNVLCFLVLKNFNILSDVMGLVCAGVSGILAVVLFLAMLPVFEALFRKLTTYKLAELTLHSNPLVRKLIEEAPGTFNHSIVVANLAEACATALGEDSLMARTCAYYHDIGKLRDPEFFKENQVTHNVHDEILPELSASIIKSHAKDGYELLTRRRYPKEIANVCLEHHGTLPIMYFYAKAKKFSDTEVSIEQFCYPGPKPQTKISAIIMIADGAEAAIRSLKDRSRESAYNVIDKIINDRMSLGQFDECPITTKDLNIIRHILVNNLTGIYHSRVQYPKVDIESIVAQTDVHQIDDEDEE